MGMNVGLGLYPHLLTQENFRFARQAGATHVVAHLPGWARRTGRGLPPEAMWTYEELADLKKALNEEGLEFYAIENFEVEHWYDVLLDGPKRAEQIEGLKGLLRTMGRVGIEVMGYNFSYANVFGKVRAPLARGGAMTPAYIPEQAPADMPIPNGTVWNVQYDKRLFDLYPSHHNCAEFCQGTISEMNGKMDMYQAIEAYAAQKKIAYVHFRNVTGTMPRFHEEFIDAGDIDMVKALRLYHKHGFDGVLIPDHTPEMSCAAPWHAGIAYALGWMRAAVSIVEAE